MAEELKKFGLSAIAIISLTVIVLIGIAISTAFSKELRMPTTVNTTDTTTTSLLTLTSNISVSVGSTGTYPFLQGLTGCENSTRDVLPTASYTIAEGNKDGGTIFFLNTDANNWNNTAINCTSLEYLANSDGQSAADKFSTGLGAFGTFAVIIILAIVGQAIIALFKRKD